MHDGVYLFVCLFVMVINSIIMFGTHQQKKRQPTRVQREEISF